METVASSEAVQSVSPPTERTEHNSWAGYGIDNRYHGYSETDMERANHISSRGTAEESAEHWKEQCKYWKGVAERNQLKAAGSRASKKGGKGKNKQTIWLTDQANISNKKSLHRCTKDKIWSHNKFLHFRGQWTVYNPPPHTPSHLIS